MNPAVMSKSEQRKQHRRMDTLKLHSGTQLEKDLERLRITKRNDNLKARRLNHSENEVWKQAHLLKERIRMQERIKRIAAESSNMEISDQNLEIISFNEAEGMDVSDSNENISLISVTDTNTNI